jgi:GNAT superfamily N-acetyltransferase
MTQRGIGIREARLEDVEAIASLHVATFKETHGGFNPPSYTLREGQIYVLRRWHRHGIGRRLVEQVARRFLDGGITSMLLFGDARSPSNGFYERLGAERLQSAGGEFHGGCGWRDLRHLVAAEARPRA